MSEFSMGFVFRPEDAEKANAVLENAKLEHIIKPLNERWHVFFLADDRLSFLLDYPTPVQVLRLSKGFPFWYFSNSPDHGWGYAVFNGGEEIATLHVDYNIPLAAQEEMFAKRYPQHADVNVYVPETDPEVFKLYDELEAEVPLSPEFTEIVNNQKERANPEAFTVFGVEDSAIAHLREYIDKEIFIDMESMLHSVGEFEKTIGLDGFSWQSYRYAAEE